MNGTESPATSDGGGECLPMGFNISSHGFLENMESPAEILRYSLPLLEMQIILIFVFILVSHMFLGSIGIPQFVSHMIAGLILGPQLLDLVEFSSDRLSPYAILDGNMALECLGAFGFTMFTFLMAVKTNCSLAFRSKKRPAAIAFSSFFAPLIVGIGFKNLLPNSIDSLYLPLKKGLAERGTIVSYQSLTFLPVVTHLLSELEILNSQLGRLAVSSALISDFLGIFYLVTISFFATYMRISPQTAYRDLAGVTILLLVALLVVKPAAKHIIDITPEGKPVRKVYLYGLVITALGASALTSFLSYRNVLGPLFIGLVIPDGPPLGSALEAKFENVTRKVLLPITIAVVTMKADMIRLIYEFDDIVYNMFLVAVTLIAKWFASFLLCLLYKLPFRECVALAIIMCGKGFTELFIYDLAKTNSIISKATHTLLVLYVLLSAGIVPTVVNSIYDRKRKYVGYHKRSVMHMRRNLDLRILVCLHKPNNIPSTISFLRCLVSPNQLSPVAVTVLHLVKLTGRAFPDLISHDKNPNRVIRNSYIKTAILAFNDFEVENQESLMSMSTFTAFSKLNLMDEDIKTLALDQLTSMIVVPSGRRWSADGSFESDDMAIRRLNMSLLEHAPCSVGILVDRGYFYRIGNLKNKARANTVRVGVIFLGGKDDREALSIGKWMKPNPRVHLTVYRFVFGQQTGSTNWEYILDHEVLKDMKVMQTDDGPESSFAYVEKPIRNGPEIVTVLRSLAKEVDLVITGRDQGVAFPEYSGLDEWIELPELGIIGDLLASRELDSTVSVLVVQQQ